jgi:propanol-preferring alcohol dehydrogenase
MKAMVLEGYSRMEKGPLKARDLDMPKPGRNQLLIKITASGICHTDLHVIEKELQPKRLPVVPGHQIVGEVVETGPGAKRFRKGDRVGVTWIASTCGKCVFCRTGRENLCENMRNTGYDTDGGFAEYTLADQGFALPIPGNFDDEHAAPLFCAGIIGYRALKLSGITKGGTLAIFGFGASGHIIAQMAGHMGSRIVVFTRGKEHQKLSRQYGAMWAGEASDTSPVKADSAIITAPAGELVIDALRNLNRGGRIAIEDIYMTPIPSIDYNKYLYYERWLGSVTDYTMQDAKEFLKLASEIPIRTKITRFRLGEANNALNLLKQGKVNGAGVLIP